ITEGALLTVLYSIMKVIALYIPVVGMVVVLILPDPFIIFASRYNWKQSLLISLVAILLSIFIAAGATMLMTVLVAVGGIVTGCAIYKGLKSYETWAAGTIGFAIGLVFVYAFVQVVLKIDIMAMFDEAVDESLNLVESMDIMNQINDEIYYMFK